MNDAGRITIVLADSHVIVREGIAALLRARAEFDVVGECSDGLAALELIRSLSPEFAVIDLNIRNLHGIEVIRKVRSIPCLTKIIALSMSRDEEMLKELFRSGADGFLLREDPTRHLIDAISYIQDGGKYLTPLISGTTLGNQPGGGGNPLVSLSRREYETFALLVDGMRPKDIAAMMNISPKTVDTYRSNIMRKLGFHDIVSLVKFAIEKNFTSSGMPSPAEDV
ncbi:MAG: response regulator transcription factor [Acidobacteriota bacterium]|nr:response regulator transcription factor [Acidobacteriota bacterium]